MSAAHCTLHRVHIGHIYRLDIQIGILPFLSNFSCTVTGTGSVCHGTLPITSTTMLARVGWGHRMTLRGLWWTKGCVSEECQDWGWRTHPSCRPSPQATPTSPASWLGRRRLKWYGRIMDKVSEEQLPVDYIQSLQLKVFYTPNSALKKNK